MSDLSHPGRPVPAERYLGLGSVLAGAAGLIALCGSPDALWSYAADLADMLWWLAASFAG
jgi:hypothetical protein